MTTYMKVLSKIQWSDHRTVRWKVRVNLKRERRKLVKSKKLSFTSARDRARQFNITLQNKFVLLDGKNKDRVDTLDNNVTTIEYSGAGIVETACRKETLKLTQETKELIAKRQNIQLSNTMDQMESAQLLKLINRRKTNDIRA